MPIGANEVGPTPGLGFSGFFTTAANGGVSQLIDVSGAFLSGLKDGSKVWVQSFRDSFTWYSTRTDTPDNVTVVKPTVVGAGAGRFIRDLIPSPTWMTQATWFIGTTGNDENSGVTSLLPLRTDAERQRRWGLNEGATVNIAVTVTYLNDPGDQSNYDVSLGPNGTLSVVGTMSVAKSGLFNVVTSLNRGTQTPWSATSTPAFDGTEIGRFLRVSSGANVGLTMGAVKNTAGSLRLTTPAVIAAASFSFTTGTPVHNDPYDVLVPVHLNVGRWTFTSHANAASFPAEIAIDGLSLDGSAGGLGTVFVDNNPPVFSRCVFAGLSFMGPQSVGPTAFGCMMSGTCIVSTTSVFFRGGGGLSGGLWFVTSGGNTNLDSDFLFQNAGISVQLGTLQIGLAAAFDNGTTGAITGGLGAQIVSAPIFSTDLLWGTGNTGHAVEMHQGGYFCYTTKPTINGGLGAGRESLVGAQDKTWPNIPFADTGPTGSQSAIVVKA